MRHTLNTMWAALTGSRQDTAAPTGDDVTIETDVPPSCASGITGKALDTMVILADGPRSRDELQMDLRAYHDDARLETVNAHLDALMGAEYVTVCDSPSVSTEYYALTDAGREAMEQRLNWKQDQLTDSS